MPTLRHSGPWAEEHAPQPITGDELSTTPRCRRCGRTGRPSSGDADRGLVR